MDYLFETTDYSIFSNSLRSIQGTVSQGLKIREVNNWRVYL